MSPTATKAIRNVGVTLAVVGLGVGAAQAWKRYGRLDPYAAMNRKRPAMGGASIQANGVTIRHYQGGKLVAQADASSLTVNGDRSDVDLHDVHNGVANTAQGPMNFQAKDGRVMPNLRTVSLSGAVQVNGKDGQGRPYLIQTAQAKIDGARGQISVPTPLKGVIMGGKFVAKELEYRPNRDYTHLKEIAWQGPPPQEAVPAGAQPGSYWNIESEDSEKKGVNVVHIGARAEDGKVIVMAPRVEQNTKTDVLTATGRATYRSAKADLVADKIVVYRKEGRAEFTGNVVMLVHAKKDWDNPLPKNDVGAQPMVPKLPAGLKKPADTPAISEAEKKRDDDLRSGKTLQDYPMNLKAESVTYWYKDGNRHAVAKGGDPTAYQSFEDGRWWRQAKAPEAHYDGEKDLLDMVGDGATRQIHLKNSLGDWLDAAWMQLSTKEDQTEENEYVKSKLPKGHTTAHDDDAAGIPTDGKKGTPPAKTPPPGGAPPTTPPPAKTGP